MNTFIRMGVLYSIGKEVINMDDDKLAEQAIDIAMDDVGDNPANTDVLVEMSAARFNELADDIGYEPDVSSAAVLEAKLEARIERRE